MQVKPLRKHLTGLKAWITGQRKDQSPGTRMAVPVVEVDPVFTGLEGGPGSLIKCVGGCSMHVWVWVCVCGVRGWLRSGGGSCNQEKAGGRIDLEGVVRWDKLLQASASPSSLVPKHYFSSCCSSFLTPPPMLWLQVQPAVQHHLCGVLELPACHGELNQHAGAGRAHRACLPACLLPACPAVVVWGWCNEGRGQVAGQTHWLLCATQAHLSSATPF